MYFGTKQRKWKVSIMKYPTSFKVFIIAIVFLILFCLIIAILFTNIEISDKYEFIFGFILMLIMSFIPIGIYTGVKFKSENNNTKRFNLVGLIGNLLIYLLFLLLMTLGALEEILNIEIL